MKPTLNPVLRSFWEARARNRILYGGRASSKSWDAAGRSVGLSRIAKLRFLCCRQFQNRIDESVYTLIKNQITRFGLRKEFNILKAGIEHKRTGSEYLFYGIHRNIDEIKSTEDVDILWIEEAHNLTEEQWRVLEPTIRKDYSEVWIIFNPNLMTDFVYRRFVINPPPNTIVRQINYPENPFLSQTILDVIENAKEEDYEEYEHVYLGVPRTDDDQVIIKRSWILAAIDAHKTVNILEPSGSKRIGFDVADSGNDKCAMIQAHGPVVQWADLWKGKEDELLKSCARVFHQAVKTDSEIIYDSIGVGAASGSKFNELNVEASKTTHTNVAHRKFNAGEGVYRPEAIYDGKMKNKDMFLNIKAQAWWLVADRFRNTYNAVREGHEYKADEMISIDSSCPHLNQLIDELSTPKRDFDNNGKVKVESKKDLAKREIASPNLADAFICCFAPGRKPMAISNEAMQAIKKR